MRSCAVSPPFPGLVADRGDAVAADVEQVLGGGAGGGYVVDGHVVVGAAGDALAEQDQGPRGVAVREVGLGERERAEDHAVEHRGHRAAHHDLALSVRLAVGLVDDDGVAVLAGFGHDGAVELGEVGDVEFRHHQRDHAGAALAQVAGHQVRLVAEFCDGGLDAGAPFVGHPGVSVDHVGDCADRDPGALGDVAQARGAHLRASEGRVRVISTMQSISGGLRGGRGVRMLLVRRSATRRSAAAAGKAGSKAGRARGSICCSAQGSGPFLRQRRRE